VPAAVERALGQVTDAIAGAERRLGQIEMAQEVAAAFSNGHPVIIEAGTGTGKSLAYLVPAALSGQRVVVATATKALQDQLINKEVPAINRAGLALKAAVLKGRLNYLCLKKHADTLALPPSVFKPSADDEDLKKINAWAKTTVSGERDELDFEPSGVLWASLSMSADECPGAERCPFGQACFTERAKAKAAEAEVVIVNSALYGAHLSTGRTLLPEHSAVVFDEAHELPDILSRSLGAEISAARVHAVAGLARNLVLVGLSSVLDALHSGAEALGAALEFRGDNPVGIDEATGYGLAAIDVALRALFSMLEEAGDGYSGDKLTLLSVRGVVVHLRSDLDRFLKPAAGDLIFVEGDTRPTLVCAPVEVGGMLGGLWAEVTAVLTSATIPDNLAARLGLGDCATIYHPSPFDYPHHALLYVPTHLSDRRHARSEDEIAGELGVLIKAAGGRTLALFTSRRALGEIGDRVRGLLDTPVLIQGESSRSALLKDFEENEETSLFATMGFWQGVDIPGKTLSLLTIDRLPFSRPNEPMAMARRELAGPKAFYAVDIPRAAMLLAQGMGRLIRNATDKGVVCVFDTRLATASYRGALLNRLPPMKRTTSQGEVVAFLEHLTR
jgi:ATP-dependent DNA helicase DinG